MLPLQILVEFLKLEYLIVAVLNDAVPLRHLLAGKVPLVLDLF